MSFARQETIKLANRHVVFFPPGSETGRVREQKIRQNVLHVQRIRRLLRLGPIAMGGLLAFLPPLGLYLLWSSQSRYSADARYSLTIVSVLGSMAQLLLLAALCH